MTSTSVENFTYLGTTAEYTECECCGKQDLKKTVKLLDDKGKDYYYGVTCARYAAGWDSKEYQKRQRDHAKAMREAAKLEEWSKPVKLFGVEFRPATSKRVWTGRKYRTRTGIWANYEGKDYGLGLTSWEGFKSDLKKSEKYPGYRRGLEDLAEIVKSF